MTGKSNYYKKGTWNVICDTCGQKFKRDQCKKQWDGIIACNSCYDSKHPYLEPIPVMLDGLGVPDARPRPDATFISDPAGTSIWGTSYYNEGVTVQDIIWDNWTTNWDTDDTAPFSDIPLR